MQKHNIKDKSFIDWYATLKLDKYNQVKPLRENIHIILKNDKYLNGVGRYNQFNERFEKYKFSWINNTNSKDFTENDYLKIIEYLESRYGITAKATIRETIYSFMCNFTYHPVKDYLNSLPKWDGVKRIETIFGVLFGVADNEYVRVISKKWFMAGIARIFEPGCKFDYMLVISGSEGIGKSTFASKLCNSSEWYTDDLGQIGEKDGYERINGIWIAEYAELKDMRKINVATLKSYVSKQCDVYRAAYAKEKTEHKRQCIFFGTTNESDFLRGSNGNRRFWILEARKEYQEKHPATLTKSDINNLWAEAYYYYMNQSEEDKNNLNYLTKEIEDLAEEQRKEFYEMNPYQDEVNTYVETLVPNNFESWTVAQKHLYYSYDEKERLNLLAELGKNNETLVHRQFYSAIQFWKEFKGIIDENKKLDRIKTLQINSALKNCESKDLYYDEKYRPRIKLDNVTFMPKGILMRKTEPKKEQYEFDF